MEMIIFSHRRSSRYTSHWPSRICVVYPQTSSDPQMRTTLRCEQRRPARAQTILLQTLLITDVQSPGSQVESRYAPGPFTRCVCNTTMKGAGASRVGARIVLYIGALWMSPAIHVVCVTV